VHWRGKRDIFRVAGKAERVGVVGVSENQGRADLEILKNMGGVHPTEAEEGTVGGRRKQLICKRGQEGRRAKARGGSFLGPPKKSSKKGWAMESEKWAKGRGGGDCVLNQTK